jgi:hypothetical protein
MFGQLLPNKNKIATVWRDTYYAKFESQFWNLNKAIIGNALLGVHSSWQLLHLKKLRFPIPPHAVAALSTTRSPRPHIASRLLASPHHSAASSYASTSSSISTSLHFVQAATIDVALQSACWKRMFQMFPIFQRYIASVSYECCKYRWGYCICCNCCTRMLQESIFNVSSIFRRMLQVFLYGCCIYFARMVFIWMLRMFASVFWCLCKHFRHMFWVFHLSLNVYCITSVVSGCFKSRSGVTHICYVWPACCSRGRGARGRVGAHTLVGWGTNAAWGQAVHEV